MSERTCGRYTITRCPDGEWGISQPFGPAGPNSPVVITKESDPGWPAAYQAFIDCLAAQETGGVGGGGGGTSATCEIQRTCMLDDVNGDGSVLTTYWTACQLCVTAGALTSTPLGDFADKCLSTAYAPANPVDPNGAGVDVEKQNRILLDGTAGKTQWSPTALTTSYTVRVKNAGGTEPTYTDSASRTTNIELGETFNYRFSGIADTAPVVNVTAANAEVVITYIEKGV